MKLFLDANILVSVLNKEYPSFSYSARVLSLADKHNYQLFTSPICLAIAFYFSEKKSGSKAAKNKIGILLKKIGIAEADQSCVKLAVENKKVFDLEDGLEYYAALNAGCKHIITQDVDDFYFSEIKVLSPADFLRLVKV